MALDHLSVQTIQDFGEQWNHFTENEGYYGSSILFQDILGPHIETSAFADSRVADIGSGTGRIVTMLHDAGCREIVAVEPSEAMTPLQRNTRRFREKVKYLKVPGDQLAESNLDYVVSFGVLHHIPDPDPVVKASFNSLRSGGKAVFWLYGYEGNEVYLAFAEPLRKVTTRLPHALLNVFAFMLMLLIWAYSAATRFIPLPMAKYMRGHFAKLPFKAKVLTIYDQLNPAYAKYYRRSEVEALMRRNGFVDFKLFHRHGYSWTVVGSKP